MKKILVIILMTICVFGYSQTAKEYFKKAHNYDASGEYQLAIDNYTKCIKLQPEDVNLVTSYYNRGIAYKRLGNYEDAIADYTRALRIDPDYVKAYINRGNTYDDLGNHEDAIADYTRALRIDPDDAIAYKNRGIAKERSGLPYCSDYKRACDLGKEDCCEWYDDQCR